jgi:chromosome partitioning protein
MSDAEAILNQAGTGQTNATGGSAYESGAYESNTYEISADESGTSRTRPYVVAVANQKGGVAKTTTVVSLGGALVGHEKEVLLIDLDAQANLTLALGNDPARIRASITEVLFDSTKLVSVSRETSIPGLDLVPSNSGMELAERFLPVRKDYELILRNSLNTDLAYDFVILDCPPLIGAVTVNALIAADMLIVPTQTEYFSAHALKSLMGTIRRVRDEHNPSLIYRILITMYDRRNRIHREVGEQIRSAFGAGVFQTEIGIDTKLRESAVEGLPISHYRSRSRSAEQYDALAQEIMQYAR